MAIDAAQDLREKNETRDRIIRLEMTAQGLADNQQKMAISLDKIAANVVSRDNHAITANSELQQALFQMTTQMTTLSVSIGDLKDSVKDLKMSQDKLSREMVGVLSLQDDVRKLEVKTTDLQNRIIAIEAVGMQAKGGWRVMAIGGTIISVIWGVGLFVAKAFFGVG